MFHGNNGIMDDFKAYLAELDWSKAEFARRTGYHPKTISNWKHPPKIAMIHLRLMVDLRRLSE